MNRQFTTPRKKRGPPPTGKGEPILVRLQPGQLSELDRWIARQDHQPSRPEAIRRLLDAALTGSRSGQRSHKARSKAHELASAQLDKIIDSSAPDEKMQKRKRKLLKGPREFRDIRNAVRSKAKS